MLDTQPSPPYVHALDVVDNEYDAPKRTRAIYLASGAIRRATLSVLDGTADTIQADLHRYWGSASNEILSAVSQAFRAARESGRKNGIPCLLTWPDMEMMMIRSRCRCEVSGIRFSGVKITGARRRPFVPSIDRIRAKEAYSPENCRLTCWSVNLAINDWGEEVFWRLVETSKRRMRK